MFFILNPRSLASFNLRRKASAGDSPFCSEAAEDEDSREVEEVCITICMDAGSVTVTLPPKVWVLRLVHVPPLIMEYALGFRVSPEPGAVMGRRGPRLPGVVVAFIGGALCTFSSLDRARCVVKLNPRLSIGVMVSWASELGLGARLGVTEAGIGARGVVSRVR